MKTTKRIKHSKNELNPIALNSPVVKENLPLPFVHYPNYNGTFLGFSDAKDGIVYFCLCCSSAIENIYSLSDFEVNNSWNDNRISAPLSSHFFPNSIAQESNKKNDTRNVIQYRKGICHRCNLSTPSLRYCDEMYGGNFKQFYGWYINQTALKFGIRDTSYIPEITPDELIIIIDEISKLIKLRNNLADDNHPFNHEEFLKISEIDKEIVKLKRKVTKEIENTTRQEFGFRKIGEGNVSETILTKIVSNIFLNEKIIRHHRPNWLNGLELDIYIPRRKIGIEYQGQQHYYPIKAWGGKKALKELQNRDKLKKKLCIENGIKLYEFDYTEPLEFNYIKKKISY